MGRYVLIFASPRKDCAFHRLPKLFKDPLRYSKRDTGNLRLHSKKQAELFPCPKSRHWVYILVERRTEFGFPKVFGALSQISCSSFSRGPHSRSRSAMTAEKKVALTCRCIPTGTEEPTTGVASRLTLAHCCWWPSMPSHVVWTNFVGCLRANMAPAMKQTKEQHPAIIHNLELRHASLEGWLLQTSFA